MPFRSRGNDVSNTWQEQDFHLLHTQAERETRVNIITKKFKPGMIILTLI